MVRKITFGDHDGGKSFKGLGNHALDQFLFLLGGGSGWIEKVFEGATFEGEGGETEDFGKSLVVEGLHDDADAPGDAKFMCDNMGGTHGGVVTPRCTDGIEIDDDGLVSANESEFMIEVITGGDFASRAVDMQKNGGDGIVIRGLTDLENEVVDHA